MMATTFRSRLNFKSLEFSFGIDRCLGFFSILLQFYLFGKISLFVLDQIQDLVKSHLVVAGTTTTRKVWLLS